MSVLNKTLKMTLFDLLMITFLTHVIAHALKKVDLIEFIKSNLGSVKENGL
jgi:hypothetical protein